MTFRTLIRRSLRHHWRAHLGVTLGAAIGSAALIGALVVGDSVRGSLRARALARLGPFALALEAVDRFFLESLLPVTSAEFRPSVQSVLILKLRGTAVKPDGSARANGIQVLGVDARFWQAGRSNQPLVLQPGQVAVNAALARKLGVREGDAILVRLDKPAAFAREMPLSPTGSRDTVLRATVQRIVSAAETGDLSLQAGSAPPLNLFVDLHELGKDVGLPNRANVLLIPPRKWIAENQLAECQRDLGREWVLADAQAQVRLDSGHRWCDLVSDRIFLDPPLAMAAVKEGEGMGVMGMRMRLQIPHEEILTNRTITESEGTPDDSWWKSSQPNEPAIPQPRLTYLVNLLHTGTNAAPYSMITAAGAPWTPADMRDDEILVGQWLADDLRVKPGDEIALSYFDPESGARLVERTNSFRVRGIVPMEMPWADRTLMPDFPGIEKAERTSDWDAGFPLTHKIRPRDEEYWKQFRGTPKAFITLASGQKMWGNRFGNLTAIRFSIPPKPTIAAYFRAELEEKILSILKPEDLGLRFEPAREQALKAAEQSQDFGGLFLGFSFFLIAAALLLMAMLFQLGLEQRAPEIGTLLALGFTPKQVRKLLFGEGAALAFLGGALGALGGLAYANAMLHGLTTVWRDAVGGTTLNFHMTGQTLVIGLFASVVVSVVTIWLALRKIVRRPAVELLAGEVETAESKVQSPRSKIVAVGTLIAALALVGWRAAKGDTANAGAFFGAGALVLIAGLGFANAWLARLNSVLRTSCPQDTMEASASALESNMDLSAGRRQHVSLGSLGLSGCARRRKRSLATVAMLACGCFLIVSIAVFRLDANRDATQRSSGTGGFALIGEATMPVVQDLNSPSGRDFFALKEADLKGVSFVSFRVREGDEASCLNLNRAQKPRLLGVKPEMLEGRFAFATLMSGVDVKTSEWSILSKTNVPDRAPVEQDEIPAIGDANSIQWAMGKKVGDTIDYVDERGQPFKVRIVGAVANSILQGELIIDEAEFVKRFPGESGYRQFLIDTPTNRVAEVSGALSRAMQDVGLELTPASQRLAQFNAVQNTYLGTFQVLGGLGLLLGSVGLGIVVLRNVLERRGELAVLLAVGFRKPMLQRLLLIENGALLGLGLALGVVAAGVAVLPALLSPGTQLPWLTLALTLSAVLLNGVLWTWAATRAALRGDLLAALRNE